MNLFKTVFIISLLTLIACTPRLRYKDATEILKTTIYPHQVKAPYSLIIRYESKEHPEKWVEQKWKKDNDILEKSGLIKQIYKDSSISYYIHSQARYEQRKQYLYKVTLNDNIKNLMIKPEFFSKTMDEYDYDNRHTGRKDWLRGDVICGEMKLDTILTIDQKQGPLDVFIRYKEKFEPTPFNEFVDYKNKFAKDQIFTKTITARKYPDEDWKLVY